MMNILDHTKPHQHFFEEMTRIPHGSFHEKEYSDYLVTFAKERGLRYVQDDMYNVIIYAPASQGYEDHEILLLQAHMDMVCEKNKDVEFDFEKEPLQLYIEDGWLKAKGTTLGADDGCGVAAMLAILDGDMPHPSLECVFTVQEEVGLCGALHLDGKYIHAKRVINLDGGGEVSTCTTSAGGANVISQRTFMREPISDPVYRLSVTGLSGGHSGGEIHREKGNANKLLARTLYAIAKKEAVSLIHVEGGMKDNAIPREAFASFSCKLDGAAIQEIVNQVEQEMKKELEFSDPNVKVSLTKGEGREALSVEDSLDYLRFMTLLPHGMHHHSMSIEGLTTASMNAAVVTCDENTIMVNCSVRGALESYIDTICEEIELLADAFGFTHVRAARYPAWNYDAKSAMRETLQKVFRETHGGELELIAEHGGLECGVFKAIDADMDIVTMGPITLDIHTPQERLELASFDRTFELLCAFIKEL